VLATFGGVPRQAVLAAMERDGRIEVGFTLEGRLDDPAEQLCRVVASGHTWCLDGHGAPRCTRLDLDRVLHHEERHAQQWAARGYLGMLTGYGRELFRELAFGATNRLEADAGLADGGYRA